MTSLKAKITEQDQNYITEFSLYLVQSVGAIQTADPLVFELPEGSDATERYHGLELVSSNQETIEQNFSLNKLKIIAPIQEIKPIQSTYSLNPGDIIVVGKWIAKKIAEKSGYSRPHYAFEIMEVEAETEKAFRLKVKLSAYKTVYCGVCGIKLTNPESIAIGIGPICADKSGISYEFGALDSLAEKLRVTTIVSTWLPKSSIKSETKKSPLASCLTLV
jgi:hypothetical protein